MSWLRRLPALFEGQVRYLWIYLLLPILFTVPSHGDAVDRHVVTTWLCTTAMVVCIGLPMGITYERFFARWAGSHPLSLRALPFHVGIIAGWVLLGVEVGALLVSPLVPPALLEHLKGDMRLGGLLGAPIVVAGILSYERYQELRTRELRAQRAALAAHVQALQARIHPHFLFNCLNAASSLIEEDPGRAEAALMKVSDLLRYTLQAANKPLVPLANELRIVEGFLELETLRHPDRLKVNFLVEKEMGEILVPPLLLQPVVENAVLHGIAQPREGGRLEIQIQREGEMLRMSVEDDGPGPGRSGHRGAGIALRDLRKRLSLLYGEAATLEVEQGPLGGCRVVLHVPLRARELPPEPAE